ncbi:MAG TPA: efflux RND transporter periplasmic adaptor subunit, partial [Bradyrhizobium sp.]|uniref:efflux RND transporter periplasmic adaptor subunit n=1 Tax=Bradyrhizobium sp. TaxID=376 RepID=UPI002CEC4D40
MGIAVLAIAAGGGYYAYTHYLHAVTVTTSVATLAPVSEAIYGTGTVEPARWAKVVPLQRRRLVDLCSCEGQTVKAGQILGRQDDAEERNALNELQLSSQQAQRDLDRAEKDRTKSDAAQKEYEERWTQAQEYKTRIAAQQVRIDQLVLRAPLDGMVLRRDGEVGEIAGPTDVLFWVGPPLPMQVVAEVNEEEINHIAVGQKALLRSDAFPGRVLRASVSQITPKGDPKRKTFRVYLLLPNDTPLRIGMSVEANIIFREKPSAIVVPAEAVANGAAQIVNNGRLERVPVRLGIRGSRNVEIIGDVSRGMAVLSPARPDLPDGTLVRIERNKETIEPQDASPDAAPDQAPADRTQVASMPVSPAPASSDPDDAVISTAISAHIDSVV